MDETALFTPGAPALVVVDLPPRPVEDLLWRWREQHPGSAVVRLRGAKARTVGAFFDEAAAALQFPYYFGENWDAFWDCVTDLEWVNADGYLLVVDNADQLLAEDPADLDVLLHELTEAHDLWARQPDVGVAFTTVLACPPAHAAALRIRLEQGGHRSTAWQPTA